MIVRSITLLGHKDHGKSTLIGKLLMLTKSVTQIRIKEAETYSKKLHKGFEPAFILDSFHEEREHGLTIDITRAEIAYKSVAFSLIDVPGHEELITNMISGASYGELAVLLVSAKPGEGIRDQTKRHLFIAHMLGMDRLVVAVNKMDTVDYGEEAFRSVELGLRSFIAKIGFAKRNVSFVPISAYMGENLVKPSKRMRWYLGKPLLEVLRASVKLRAAAAAGSALRMLVQGTIPSNEGDLVAGKMASGSIRVGDSVAILPAGLSARVRRIIVKDRSAKAGKAGENIAVLLDKPINSELRGSVLAGANGGLNVTDKVRMRIFVTHTFGRRMHVKFNGVEIPCRSVKILRNIDATTGDHYGPTAVKPLDAVEAEVILARGIPVESYASTRELGRFVLYTGREFAGIGVAE